MNEQDRHHLSAEGRRRKEVMLDELLKRVDRRRSARTARRRGTWVAGALVIGLFAARMVMHSEPEGGRSPDRIVQSSPDGPADIIRGATSGVEYTSETTFAVRIVTTGAPTFVTQVVSDPTAVSRLRSGELDTLVRRVDDRELLDSLASINRPTGLIRIGDEVRLSRPVSDAELALLPPTPSIDP